MTSISLDPDPPYNHPTRTRVRRSVQVLWHRRMVLSLMTGLIVMLGGGYIFGLNAQNVMGYEYNILVQKNSELKRELAQIESSIARANATEYIAEASQLRDMVAEGRPQYYVVTEKPLAFNE